MTHGFRQAILVGAGATVAALLLAVFVLSNSANRAFVRMAHDSGADEPGLMADAISEVDGIGAIAGFEAEHDVEAARNAHAEAALAHRT